MTPARRRTSKVATPPGGQAGELAPTADPWALLAACRAVSAELALPPLLIRLASALAEASGAGKVWLVSCREGKLLIEAEAAAGPGGEVEAQALEAVPLADRPDVPGALVEAAVRLGAPQGLDEVAPARRSVRCAPILRPALGPRPAEVVAVACLESDEPGAFGPELEQAVEPLIEQAAVSLENARLHRETQAALRVREDFLSVAAHELYTPLSSLKLVLDTLSPTVPGAPAADEAIFAQSVDIARRQGRRLERLIRELLEVSRADTGKLRLNLQEIDLHQLAREVVEHLGPDIGRSGCQVSVAAGGPVLGRWDRSRLDQVIANLLSNAIKFGAGRPVEVTVSRTEGAARLVVRDHGMGIDPCEQGFIFDRFQRAASSRHYGGLGLGLYICRAIVQAHGGSITVDSAPGAGATFTVDLPP